MTKKDYEMVAGVIAKYNKQAQSPLSVDFVTDLTRAFIKDNPKFDSAKFFRACYPEAETEG